MNAAAAVMVLALAAAVPAQDPASSPAATGGESAHDLMFLADHRPVFVRLRITNGDKPFDASWVDSIRAIYSSLDRNGDGTLTVKEADAKFVVPLLRLARGAAVPPKLPELDVSPKDGKVSIEELAEALRPIVGPFQLQVERQAVGRTDALFDQLDRDKDGLLTRSELSVIRGSVRPLDLDDDQMISAYELDPFNDRAMANVAVNVSPGRQERLDASPPVVELLPGESTLRPARLLLRKYDKAKEAIPGSQNNKLSSEELAIDPDAFTEADKNHDGSLDLDELRKFFRAVPIDVTLDVSLPSDASRRAMVHAASGVSQAKEVRVRQITEGDVEIVIGQVRVDVRVDDRPYATGDVARILTQRFKAADANKDGYLEGKELEAINGPQSPLAGLAEVIDRNGDKKIYLKELLEFGDRQNEAARGRLLVNASDQGRAIFGIVDLDRDRRLGARELMRAVERVTSWDGDSDGRVSADEIPYHFQVGIGRGGLVGLTGGVIGAIRAQAMTAARGGSEPGVGPVWFQKMDRNHDGDVSRREFLGPREAFDRLDKDTDGLIDAEEASAAKGKDSP